MIAQSQSPSLNRWAMMAIGFAIELVLGLLYAWSVFVLPLEHEFGWLRAQTSLAFTVSLIFFPAGMFVGGRLTDRHGMRLTGSLSASLLGAGLWLTSYTGSIPWLVVSFGLLGGLAIGACGNTTANLLSWFDERRGLAAGLLSMGFGLGGLVLGSLANGAIVILGWRAAFRLLAAIAFVICLGGFQFLRKAPAGWNSSRARPEATTNYAPTEMLRTSRFWLLQTWSLLVSTAGVMVIGHVVPLAVELGLAQSAAVLALGALSLANGLGRPVYGILSDRLGLAPTMFAGALLMGLALLFTIPLTRTWGAAGLVGTVILVGSSYGSMVPLNTSTVMHLFGTEHYGTNLGLSTFQIALSGVLGPQLAAVLRESTGAYNLPLALTGILALGACAIALLFGLMLRRAARPAVDRS